MGLVSTPGSPIPLMMVLLFVGLLSVLLWRCNFCEYLNLLFTSLKQYLKDNQLAAQEGSKFLSPKIRSQSDESQLSPNFPENNVNIARGRLSSCVPSMVPDMDINSVAKFKESPKKRSELKKHINSKKLKKDLTEEISTNSEKTDESETDAPTVNISRYGSKVLTKESCVYKTPTEGNGIVPSKRMTAADPEEDSERISRQTLRKDDVDVIDQGKGRRGGKGSKRLPLRSYTDKDSSNANKLNSKRKQNQYDASQPSYDCDLILRRTILDPFKKASKTSVRTDASSSTEKAQEAQRKITLNPKTIKERQNNVKALAQFNKDHEDDLFGEIGGSKELRNNLLKAYTKTLPDNSDSESENEISIHAACTPVSNYMKGRRDAEKTPVELKSFSPLDPPQIGFQRQAYIQKKLAEKEKDARKDKKPRQKHALLTKVTSRALMDDLVDQSSRVIKTMTQKATEEHDEDAEDWFSDSGDNRLTCDPGAGLLRL